MERAKDAEKSTNLTVGPIQTACNRQRCHESNSRQIAQAFSERMPYFRSYLFDVYAHCDYVISQVALVRAVDVLGANVIERKRLYHKQAIICKPFVSKSILIPMA